MRLTSCRAAQAGEPPCQSGNEAASAEAAAAELAGASSKVSSEAWGQVRLSLGLALGAGLIIGAVYGPNALFQYLSVYLVEQVVPPEFPMKALLHDTFVRDVIAIISYQLQGSVDAISRK